MEQLFGVELRSEADCEYPLEKKNDEFPELSLENDNMYMQISSLAL